MHTLYDLSVDACTESDGEDENNEDIITIYNGIIIEFSISIGVNVLARMLILLCYKMNIMAGLV